jgi:large subunit ribosomal protein L9
MEVILLDDVDNVGLKGDLVNVARGYARNYLLPRRLAEEATSARVAELQKHEAHRARQEAQSFDQAREIAGVLEQTILRFDVKAGPTGSLFGSVTPTDIVDEVWRLKKIRIDRRKVGTEPIKRIGRYTVPVEVFQDVTVDVQTHVVPEGGELPPEAQPQAEPEAEPQAELPVRVSGPVEGVSGEPGGSPGGEPEAQPPVRDSGPVEGVSGVPGGYPRGEPSAPSDSQNSADNAGRARISAPKAPINQQPLHRRFPSCGVRAEVRAVSAQSVHSAVRRSCHSASSFACKNG